MIFKKIRPLIFSPLVLIVGDEEIADVEVNDPAIDIYDYYEVIGISAWAYAEDNGAVVVSLRPTIINYYEKAATQKVKEAYESCFMCKK